MNSIDSSLRETHLRCTACRSNPTIARLGSEAHVVCHCTHVDGELDPLPVEGAAPLPEPWEFVPHGGAPHVE